MGSLRVIGGTARGRRLRSVPGDTTRPITDRTKESLFNIIGGDINGASLLDLFGGTGSVGIEALSRGASFVRFIEKAPAAAKTIRLNLEIAELDNPEKAERPEIILIDAFVFLDRPSDRQFDYVYIAPPQYKSLWKRALLSLDKQYAWLSEDAWVIVQIHPIEYEEIELENLEEFDKRHYGSTLLVFYRGKTG
jgi:16S rRNA (guanine966-N2)-methyltransferase